MHQQVSEEDIKRKMDKIKHKIAVMSGKGGVGKSTITALLAVHLAKKGKLVGILDADFLGPSIPRIFGLEGKKPVSGIDGIEPILSAKYGIRIMSIQFLIPHKEVPVIWRGPMIAGVLKDFLGNVSWGNLDYLIFDLPPGTGDAPLTVMQTVPLDGIVMVASPQELTASIVEKAINMAYTMNTKIIGLVENMSYYKCPDCGRVDKLFGEGKSEHLAKKYNLNLIAKIPIDPQLARLCDRGLVEEYEVDHFSEFEL